MRIGQRNESRGFTLIELIVVITIIAILAAVAIPRLINAQTDARIAKTQAIYGAIKSAAMLAKARCELDLVATPLGPCTSTAGQVLMDGTLVDMVNRYPAGTLTGTGIDAATQLTANEGVTISGTNPRLFQINGATTAVNCQVSYTEASAPGNSPTIVPSTTGC